jgi:flagellar basal-body rod protein FlgF
MDRMIFIAMNGAKDTMKVQSINSNNLANASTIGFKSDFHTMLSQQVYGPVHPSRVYAGISGTATDESQGSVVTTGRDLDIAINGKGWFAIQAADGSEAYTRAGDLRLDSVGRLTTGAGNVVIGNGGPISVPAFANLEVGSDGTISIQPLGQDVNALAVVDRIKLINPEKGELKKGNDGLMHLLPGKTAVENAEVQVISGSLESSNVSTSRSLVEMIRLARQYETHVKLMETAESNDRASTEMMKLS